MEQAYRTEKPIPGEVETLKNLHQILPRWKSSQQGTQENDRKGFPKSLREEVHLGESVGQFS